MSRRQKRSQPRQALDSSSAIARLLLPAILLSVVLVVVIFMSSGSESSPPTDSPSPPSSPSRPANVGDKGEIEERVIGRWLRTDGDYFIEITKIDDDGKLQAGYYNPYPINIAEAKVLPDADVFMKLQDENYPGSTYTLNYEPENDTLTGIYFHAGLQQEFEVIFNRLEVKE